LAQGTVVSDFQVTQPASCGFALLSRGLQLQFDTSQILAVPVISAGASGVSFVAEGAPFPVRQDSYDTVTLTPQKFAAGLCYSRETFEHSTPNIEKVVGATLLAAAGLQLDAILFDASAATTVRPAGLRYQVTETAHEATATGDEAMKKDIANLVSAVVGVAGNSPIVFVAAPKTAASMRLRVQPNFPYEILASSALTAGTVIAVATTALVSAASAAPRIDTSIEAVMHFDNTTPLDITTGAVSATVKSAFQTDSIAIRLIWPLTFGMRTTGAVAWTSGTTW
jgi:Phage capsid family